MVNLRGNYPDEVSATLMMMMMMMIMMMMMQCYITSTNMVFTISFCRVSDASGKIEMTEVKKGSVTRDDLSSDVSPSVSD